MGGLDIPACVSCQGFVHQRLGESTVLACAQNRTEHVRARDIRIEPIGCLVRNHYAAELSGALQGDPPRAGLRRPSVYIAGIGSGTCGSRRSISRSVRAPSPDPRRRPPSRWRCPASRRCRRIAKLLDWYALDVALPADQFDGDRAGLRKRWRRSLSATRCPVVLALLVLVADYRHFLLRSASRSQRLRMRSASIAT